LQQFTGYRIPSLLLEVGNLGIPDLLADGPRSVEALARETHVNPDALYRVLRLLGSNGIFREVSPKTFCQTPVSDMLRVLRVLQTGRSGFELAFGVLPFEYFDQHSAESAVFARPPRRPGENVVRPTDSSRVAAGPAMTLDEAATYALEAIGSAQSVNPIHERSSTLELRR
jgi:hypothetical protein